MHYYYPYLLHAVNCWSFQHHHTIKEQEEPMDCLADKQAIDLWSFSRWSYTKYKGSKRFTASYDPVTKNYTFNGKRYLHYDELIQDAWQV